MNVIAITIDGARPDIIREFHSFDNFFKQGTYFPTTITYSPYTLASLHAIFTGIYGNENGVDNYYGSNDFKGDSCKTLAEYLRDAGYYTQGDTFNKIFIPEQGFSELTLYDEHGENIIERHKGILEEMKSKEKFFLWLHHGEIHTSLVNNVIKPYDDFSEEYFGKKDENLARYKTYMGKANDYFAEIMNECSRFDDTMVVVFSDHGVSVGERVGEKVYGSYCYDYTLKTFSFFYGPGIFPSREFTTQIRNIDVMPTILDVLNIKEAPGVMKMNGKSVMPIVNGKEDKVRIAYSETGGLGGPYPSPKKPNVRCVRTNEWKLIHNETPDTKELYDLKNDPGESKNLAGKGLKEEATLWEYLAPEQKSRKKVIILGLDGVCWDMIDGWMKEGELPTFKKLKDNYASGTLKSVIIPLTFLAWPSMFTGKNPGKHGIACIGEVNKKYGFNHFNSAKDVKSDFLWEILERNGIKCGLINIPLSSPFRSPIAFGEGDKFRKDWMNFEWKDDTRVGILPSDSNFGKRVNEIIELRFDQLEHVLENREFDFFAMDIFCLDPLQHFNWHDKDFLKDTFKRIDSRLDRFIGKLDDETQFILLSDHGMIKLEKWLRVNNWLEKKGYLRFKGKDMESSIAKAGINRENFESVTNPLISLLVKLRIKRFIPRATIDLFQKIRREQLPSKDGIPPKKLVSLVDWENTRAHALGGEGNIYLNLKGREVYGSVPEEDYEDVREQIIRDLKEDFKDIEIFKREEIYKGPHVEMSPDILFIINGGSIRASHNYNPSGSLFKEPVPGKDVLSNHSLDGILLTYGKDFKKIDTDKEIEEDKKKKYPHIYDITPTVLHIFGLPIPEDIDGRVLEEIFKSKQKIKYSKPEISGLINELDL